jgi:hypothetical protein
MDTTAKVADVTSKICSLILSGKPSKGLAMAARYHRKKAFRGDLMFTLNCAHAAVRSKSKVASTTRKVTMYRSLAKKCEAYNSTIEANFWHMNAGNAELRDNLPAALKMYSWVLELDPRKDRHGIISKYKERIEAELERRKKK